MPLIQQDFSLTRCYSDHKSFQYLRVHQCRNTCRLKKDDSVQNGKQLSDYQLVRLKTCRTIIGFWGWWVIPNLPFLSDHFAIKNCTFQIFMFFLCVLRNFQMHNMQYHTRLHHRHNNSNLHSALFMQKESGAGHPWLKVETAAKALVFYGEKGVLGMRIFRKNQEFLFFSRTLSIVLPFWDVLGC